MRFKGVPFLVAATTGAATIGCSRLRMWTQSSATSAICQQGWAKGRRCCLGGGETEVTAEPRVC
jgi:hypothetical protein